MEFDILKLDDDVCAVNKPSGIMVHASRISTDTVFLTDLLRERLERKVWPVHRLDRATSGVLLFALSAEAAAALGRQFEAASVAKRYVAITRGWLDDEAEIDRPLIVARGREREARTRYRCLARAELPVPVPPHSSARYSLAEVHPLTGRTHQIRRHFNGIAHPVVGDVRHGDRRHNRLFRARFGCHRLLLHASELQFAHPNDGASVTLRAPLPEDFAQVVQSLPWDRAPEIATRASA